MELTSEQFERITALLPVQRGNVKYSHLHVLNAFMHVARQGCTWRGLPERFGNWQTIYRRVNRWARSGVLTRVWERLRVILPRAEGAVTSLDSTIIKVHPDGTWPLRRHGPQAVGRSRGRLTTQLHVMAAADRTPLAFSLTPGQTHDAPALIYRPCLRRQPHARAGRVAGPSLRRPS